MARAAGFYLNASNYQFSPNLVQYGTWTSKCIATGAYAGCANQYWCNPPDRGAGLRPMLDTGNSLVDAYLWIKIPGESDGECTRGLGPIGTVNPEWGRVDPGAGLWFPEMALQLARNAVSGP